MQIVNSDLAILNTSTCNHALNPNALLGSQEMIFLVFAIHNKLFCAIFYSDDILIHTLFLNSNVPT